METDCPISFSNPPYGNRRCILKLSNVVRNFLAHTNGDYKYCGDVFFKDCTIKIPASSAFNLSNKGLSVFNNVIIDGIDYMNKNKFKPVINHYAHSVTGVIAVDAVSTDTRDVIDKRKRLCPMEGEAGNFNSSEIYS